MITIYSPFPKIEYYKEGILSISYRGDRSIIAMKDNVDLEKYKYITLSNREYKTFKKIKLNNIEIENYNKNIIH